MNNVIILIINTTFFFLKSFIIWYFYIFLKRCPIVPQKVNVTTWEISSTKVNVSFVLFPLPCFCNNIFCMFLAAIRINSCSLCWGPSLWRYCYRWCCSGQLSFRKRIQDLAVHLSEWPSMLTVIGGRAISNTCKKWLQLEQTVELCSTLSWSTGKKSPKSNFLTNFPTHFKISCFYPRFRK